MIELLRIFASDDRLYRWAKELLATSFPSCERRDDDLQKTVMAHPDYRLCIISDSGEPVGVAGYFDAPDFVYFENFCISPDKRNCGYGGAALKLLTSNIRKPFILEIEPPYDELTRRRLAFYLRNGMVVNPYPHIQPHYRKDDPDLPLVVLSFHRQISPEQYSAFRAYLDENVDVRHMEIKN